MNNFIFLFKNLIFHPRKAFEKYREKRLYLLSFIIFIIAFSINIIINLTEKTLISNLSSLFYIDLIILLIIIYFLLFLFKIKNKLIDILGLLFLINMPIIICFPLLIINEFWHNPFFSLICHTLILIWKLFLFVIGTSAVFNIRLSKSLVLVFLSLIIALPISYKVKQLVDTTVIEYLNE